MDALIRDIRNSERLPGVDHIRLPGERSHAIYSERSKLGIPLAPPLVAQLEKLAAELGIEPLRPRRGWRTGCRDRRR